MELIEKDVGQLSQLNPYILRYEEAISTSRNILWQKLGEHTIGEFLEIWLSTLVNLTAINYRSGMRKLEQFGYIKTEMSLQAFALVNHDAIIDRIKKDKLPGEEWSECTRQARAACYISFTSFLSRRFQGMIKKALPCKEGVSKTFYRVHEKVKSNAMTQAHWISFLDALKTINIRDCLIAKITLQGGKRIQEVLSLTTKQIAWERNEITFVQSKTKGIHKETIITYPQSIMDLLKKYLNYRSGGLVFITKNGKKVPLNQLAKTFAKAGLKTKIPFKITPHVLRASTVTFLKQQGFSDSDIMGVTGHASSEMVYAYDKSSRANNASKKVSLTH